MSFSENKINCFHRDQSMLHVFPGFAKVTFPVLAASCALRMFHRKLRSFLFPSLAVNYTMFLQNAPVSLFSGEVGFLVEHRRINVAITRARRHLAVVADSETVSHDDFLKSLVEYMSSEGEVRSAHEYLQDSLTTAFDSYSNERAEVLLTQDTRDYKKKNGLNETKTAVAKENDVKERDELKVVGAVENRSITCEVETCTAGKVSKQEPVSITPEPLVVSEKSGQKEMNEPLSSSSSSVAVKYSREALEKEVMDFIQDGSEFELSFPKTLNSQQRFDVHSIAEKLSLCHESKGEGKDRYIVVRKAKPASKGLFIYSMSSLVLEKRNLWNHGKLNNFI